MEAYERNGIKKSWITFVFDETTRFSLCCKLVPVHTVNTELFYYASTKTSYTYPLMSTIEWTTVDWGNDSLASISYIRTELLPNWKNTPGIVFGRIYNLVPRLSTFPPSRSENGATLKDDKGGEPSRDFVYTMNWAYGSARFVVTKIN